MAGFSNPLRCLWGEGRGAANAPALGQIFNRVKGDVISRSGADLFRCIQHGLHTAA